MVETLDARAKRFAEASAKHLGRDCQNNPGAGAAGGLGYAFLQYMNADCRSGIDLLLDTIHFDDLLQDADLVITGEGSADRQTLMGKLPFGILQRCRVRNPHNPPSHPRHAHSWSHSRRTTPPRCRLLPRRLHQSSRLTPRNRPATRNCEGEYQTCNGLAQRNISTHFVWKSRKVFVTLRH